MCNHRKIVVVESLRLTDNISNHIQINQNCLQKSILEKNDGGDGSGFEGF